MSSYIIVKDKKTRFLLACLLYLAYRDDCGDHSKYDLLKIWNLDKNGPEDHYLKLLYKSQLNLDQIVRLFKQSMVQYRSAFTTEISLFESLDYDTDSDDFFCKEYTFVLSEWFFQELKGFNNVEEIDRILGWSRGTASTFFLYMYEKPFAKSIQELENEIGFKKLTEKESADSEKICLDKVPIECPYCHSRHTVQVIAGCPSVVPDPEKYYIYGCCIIDGVNPPNWYCRDCNSQIWRGISRFRDRF